MLVRCAVVVLTAVTGICSGQTATSLNLATQGRNADFSSFLFTRPMSMGPALPSSCQVGQLFFNSTASAGTNIYACSQQNTWAVVGSYTLPPAGTNSIGGVSIPSNSGLNLTSGGALSVNIGTGPGSVTAGNDPRIANALQPTSLIPAANILGLAPSAVTDTTNASNISSGILAPSLFPAIISSSTTGNAATATALALTPAGCSTNQFSQGISSTGISTCSQVAYSQLSGTPSLYNQTIQVSGTAQLQRIRLNLAAGPNVTITPSDNGTDTTTLTLSATGGLSNVAANGPLVSSGGTTPTISCPTCATGSSSFTNYSLIVGQGAQALTALPSTGMSTQVLHGNAFGPPSWSPVNLASDVTGTLSSTSINGLAASATIDTTNASNISNGTLNGSRLPNPSASTLGGVESFTAPSHQWINSISTAGVPNSTQPGFGDIAGSLGASQFPALSGDTTTLAGSTVTTTSQVNGTSVPANFSADQTVITTAAAKGSWASLPSCLDNGGNHLNYNTSTHSFSCGTTSSGGAGGVPTISSSTLGRSLNNNGAAASWSAPSLDCSQFPGADMSVKIQACLVALYGISPQGGIADARGMTGTQTWSVNPFAAASYPRSGVLLLGPGQFSTYGPVVLPSAWRMVGFERSYSTQNGTTIQANASHFQTTYSTGTVTVNGTGNVSVTGSGTTWTPSMVGCAFVAGSNIAGPSATINSYGFISAVNSATNLTLGYNGSGAASAGTSYAVYCPVAVMGDGSGTSGASTGIGLEWLGLDCNSLAGCISAANWFAQEQSYIDHVSFENFTNIGLDIEGSNAQNSGPYTNMIFTPSTSCTAGTIDLVSRVYNTPIRGIRGATAMGNCSANSTWESYIFDLESTAETVEDIHFEQGQTAIGLGENIACPVACPYHNTRPQNTRLVNIDAGGSAGPTTPTVIDIPSGNYNVSVNQVHSNVNWPNTLVDHGNGCTITDTTLQVYDLDNKGGQTANTSANCQFSLTGQTAALGSQVLLSSAPGAGFYRVNYYLDQNASCSTPGSGGVTAMIHWSSDGVTFRNFSTPQLTFLSSASSGANVGGSDVFYAASGSSITLTTAYSSCTSGTASYDLRVALEKIQ